MKAAIPQLSHTRILSRQVKGEIRTCKRSEAPAPHKPQPPPPTPKASKTPTSSLRRVSILDMKTHGGPPSTLTSSPCKPPKPKAPSTKSSLMLSTLRRRPVPEPPKPQTLRRRRRRARGGTDHCARRSAARWGKLPDLRNLVLPLVHRSVKGLGF